VPAPAGARRGGGPPPDPALNEVIFKDVSELGFAGLELFDWQITGLEGQGLLAGFVEKYKLPLISSYTSINLTDPAQRTATIEAAVAVGRTLKKYGGRTIVIGPSGRVGGQSYTYSDHKQNIVTTLNELGKAITDIVKDDLNRLMSKDMSKDDKDKLAAWMELANQVGTVVASAACNQQLAMTLGASNKPGTTGSDALTRKVNDTMDNADLYSAIAALTAACNANPVIFLKYPNNFVFAGLGINADSHNQSHRLSDASMQGPCVANAVDNLLKIDGYYAQKFANLVKMLDSIPENSGTVLDNTVAVWMNEMSDGNAHNLNNSPIIQAGSGGGYFKTGRVVNLDAASGATPQQMLGRSLSQCVDGTPQTSDGVSQGTGTEAKYGNAPVNKYFCNIMNAMGMKADANGFPAKDGPGSEVTHFGYSDKTEDFSGGAGAVQGATIHNPGAFAELKA